LDCIFLRRSVCFKTLILHLRGAIINVLADSIVDAYVSLPTGKEMWDALEVKYRVFDAAGRSTWVIHMGFNMGTELWIFHMGFNINMCITGSCALGNKIES
jgi:hypothetical protein